MFNTRICKNCFQSYTGKPEVCPNCGESLKTKAPLKNKEAKIKEPKVKKEKRKRFSSKEIMDSIHFDELMKKTTDKDAKSWREKNKKKELTPEYSVDSNGEFNVDVKDVTYFPNTYTYSAKKARGEYERPKIKWWEIYKWADLMLARRKIKKQVKKASYYRPEQIKKGPLLSLCIFFGWFGAHNFYARNYRKGWFALISFVVGCFVALASLPFLEYIRISIGGGLLFIVLCMWVFDIINIISNKYSFRLSKWKFIDCLNVDTRTTLGEKYIDKNEYKKPLIVRMVNKISKACKQNKENKKNKAEQKATELESVATSTIEQVNSNNNNNSTEQENQNKEVEAKEESVKSKENLKTHKTKKAKVVVKTKK